jgi:hypothetical protein
MAGRRLWARRYPAASNLQQNRPRLGNSRRETAEQPTPYQLTGKVVKRASLKH